MNRHVIEMVLGLLLFIGSAPAAGAIDGPPGRGGHRGPPPEAIEACKDKNEGTEVGITNHHGEKMKSTCKQINGQLVDVPESGFRGPRESHQADLRTRSETTTSPKSRIWK